MESQYTLLRVPLVLDNLPLLLGIYIYEYHEYFLRVKAAGA
jgi:hypothetical protein